MDAAPALELDEGKLGVAARDADHEEESPPQRTDPPYYYDPSSEREGWLVHHQADEAAPVIGLMPRPADRKHATLSESLGGTGRNMADFQEYSMPLNLPGMRGLCITAYVHEQDPGRSYRVVRRSSLPTGLPTKHAVAQEQAVSGCFIISLEHAQIRRKFVFEAMLPRLSSLGCEVHVVNAVDGRSMTSNELSLQAKPESEHHRTCYRERGGDFIFIDQPCTAGEIGCALSHARVLSRIVQARIPWAIVLEDDVSTPPDFAERIRQAICSVPHDAEAPLLYLGYPSQMLSLAGSGTRSGSGGGDPCSVKVHPANYVWTTYAYAVSLAAAERLLGGIAPVDKPIDHHFVLACASGAVNAYACDPQVVELAPHFVDSTVGGWS
jgi:GR25 family glycosyltransferase involved in LPS biosynthesis